MRCWRRWLHWFDRTAYAWHRCLFRALQWRTYLYHYYDEHDKNRGYVLLVMTVQLFPVVLTVAGAPVVLKPELHCLGEDKRITVGGASGITMLHLSAPSLKINASSLQGRTLLCWAQEHLQNGKKALSIVHCYDSPALQVLFSDW